MPSAESNMQVGGGARVKALISGIEEGAQSVFMPSPYI